MTGCWRSAISCATRNAWRSRATGSSRSRWTWRQDYHLYKETLARHGAPISRRLVIEELAEIQNSGYDSAVVEQVIETRKPKCAEGKRNTPYCRLARALASLESETGRAGICA